MEVLFSSWHNCFFRICQQIPTRFFSNISFKNTFLIYLRRCFSTLNSLPIERVYNTQIYYYYDFPVVVYEHDKRHHYIFVFGIHAYLYVDHNCNHSILINNNVDIQVYICIYNNGYIATNTFSMLVVCLWNAICFTYIGDI